MKCLMWIGVCVEAGAHHPPCRCGLEPGHDGVCISEVTLQRTAGRYPRDGVK